MIYKRYHVTVQVTLPTQVVGTLSEAIGRIHTFVRNGVCDDSVDVIAVKKVGEWTCDEEEVTA